MYNFQNGEDIVKKELILNFDDNTEANLITITSQNSSS